MPKGGKRETSFKPTWHHTPTKAIRVPERFASRLVDLARKLDRQPDVCLVIQAEEKKIITYEQLEGIAKAVLSDPSVTRHGKGIGDARRAVNAFIEQLLKN